MSRTFKGLLLEMNLEHNYEVKKACEDQLLNMHDDLKSQLTTAQDEITLLKAKLEKAVEQRNDVLEKYSGERMWDQSTEKYQLSILDNELNSITLESLKLSKVLDDNEDR